MNSAFSVRAAAAAAAALTVTATAFITAAIAVKMLSVPLPGGEDKAKKGNENCDDNGERGYGHQLPWDFGKERGDVAFKVYNEANQLMFKGHAVVRCESTNYTLRLATSHPTIDQALRPRGFEDFPQGGARFPGAEPET